MKQVYLDNAATTRIDDRVLESMLPWLKEKYGNASSVHSFGREAKVLLEDARDVIGEFIGSRSSEIYFTSGGTESNNFAVKGIAFKQLGMKNHIISSKIEHSAVLDTLEYLKERFGFEVTYVKTDKHGIINIDEIKNSITDKTFLISVMHSNNELGVINDISAIAEIAKQKNILLHTDSVQSIGKTEFNVKNIGCDTATLSAHKIYGPKGIGALYIKKDTLIDKYIHGGKQERDRRGGTENIAAIAGFKKAVEILKDEMSTDITHYNKLRTSLISKLKENFLDKIIINLSKPHPNPPRRRGSINQIGCNTANVDVITNTYPMGSTFENEVLKERGMFLPNIINISFNPDTTNIDADTLLIKLDMKGIAASSGSACTSGSIQPSHVLKAIGYDDNSAKSSLRISFGRFNNEEDVDYLIEGLRKII